MSDELIIREVRPEDTEAVVAIAVAAWAPIFASFRRIQGEPLFTAAHPDWRKDKGEQVRRACEHPEKSHVHVAELAGRVVGFITFYPKAETRIAEIGNNAVHPDFQGRGIGARMYEYVFEKMRQMGMRFVEVHTGGDPGHAPARRAYEKVGFDIQLPTVTYWRRL
jgi:GNAT superfamily N-acetyltransferase